MKDDWRKIAATDHFDNWSSNYENGLFYHYFFERLHQKLLSVVGDANGLSVLDIGCGTGSLLRKLSDAGAETLAGVDASGGMLDEARKIAGTREIEFIQGPAHKLPFDDRSFDLVTTSVAFHHFGEPEQVITEMGRVMKPGGRLLVCDMSGEGPAGMVHAILGKMAGDDHLYKKAEIKQMIMDNGLRIQECGLVRRLPPVFLVQATK